MRRAVALLLALFTIGLVVAGCGSSGGGSSSTNATLVAPDTLTISNFAFSPSTLTVTPGAKVTVKNTDSAAHTVTASDKSFDTGDIDTNATTTFTAPTKPGTYKYICTIHQFMQGTLTVK
ncbi:MAG TPA: cupredoxin domain-containing protein [Pseudonocardiaceae bacterium]|nr:cupredoxin domain-containing protein [Pseudonocardiaceae bacterium]